jgi:hypothetical protein
MGTSQPKLAPLLVERPRSVAPALQVAIECATWVGSVLCVAVVVLAVFAAAPV